MQREIRCTIAVLVALGLWTSVTSCWAGFDEGRQAYERGDYTTVLREWRPLAEQGDLTSQFNLGVMYANGRGIPQDYPQAIQWYRRAADQGHAGAQYNLGFMYAHGQGMPQDYSQAAQWWRLAAEQEDAQAQTRLGLMYANGQGIRQDYAEAMRWYRRAADQGHADAQISLGFLYLKGEGVLQNYAEARQWNRRAAEQGDAIAQHNLGIMYLKGQGGPQDFVQAHLWANLAAARLSPGKQRDHFINTRDVVAQMMLPAQLARAQELVSRWQPKPETPGLSSPALPVSQPTMLPAVPVSSSRRDLIRQVQERLQTAGFTPGAIDGTMGPQTQHALRWFQNAKGFLATGDLDEKTLDALGVR